MARISGVHLPDKKRIEFGLTYVYGIGLERSRGILNEAKVDFNKRVKDLTDSDVSAIQKAVSAFKVEGDLRKQVMLDIKRLQEIGSYRGLRHKKGLPVRGQRTRTNARGRKGPRKAGTAITLKKKVAK